MAVHVTERFFTVMFVRGYPCVHFVRTGHTTPLPVRPYHILHALV